MITTIGCCVLLLPAACSAQTIADARRTSFYKCADGRSFTVEENGKAARVDYFNEHYRLPRRASAIGTRFASQDATLIIDGEMAVFVTENIVDLEACRAASV